MDCLFPDNIMHSKHTSKQMPWVYPGRRCPVLELTGTETNVHCGVIDASSYIFEHSTFLKLVVTNSALSK